MKIEFKNSNLQATINSVNNIDGLNRYKTASEGSIEYWKRQKEENHLEAEENIRFFNDALTLCEAKLKGKISN